MVSLHRALLQWTCALTCLFAFTALLPAQSPQQASGTAAVRVTDFLPDGHVTDGSVSYQAQLQQAINAAAGDGGTVVFPPMTYLIDDAAGLKLSSGLTLILDGATFVVSDDLATDGQVFRGEGVEDVRIQGGTIVGRNDVWAEGVNVAGVRLVGECRRVSIRDMHIRDLSSNGIGVFAEDAEHPATDIRIVDTIIDNCCNVYGDYQAPPPQRRGPEKGSTRADQGLIAMYYVHEFSVRGCRLEDSRSDGTHFYFCRNGHFTDNGVYRAKMGGYFIESCEHITAIGNVIRDNGSRGVTIERGSQFCILSGNTIQGSGREGLWIPDSLRCVVTGNVFSLNGRKTNGDERYMIWNANITINQARGDKLNTPTAHYVIADNIIETDEHQVAAIRVDTREETEEIVIRGNVLIGANRRIVVEGPDQQAVTVEGNTGGETVRVDDE